MLVERLDELGELVAAEGWQAAAEEVARRIMADLDADAAVMKRAGSGNYAAGLMERGS
jgi:hypothetical protein